VVGVQLLMRGGEMLQQGGALPVETNVLRLAADHHSTTLASGVDRRRFTWCTLAPRNDRSYSDSRTMKRKELR
jgi:hypothetical protein